MAATGVEVLESITCGDVLNSRHRSVVIIPSTATVAEACKILARNAVSSAPVYCKPDHSFWGFFDYSDVTELIIKVFTGDSDHLSITPTLDAFLSHNSIQSAPAALVADLARKHPFDPVHETDSLNSVLPRLLKGVHRVPVTDANGAFVGVVSQSDITKTLYDNKDKISGFMAQTLSDLNLARRPVVTVAGHLPVLDALRKMHDEHVSSVAIVDDEMMIMVLTMSDLKRMFKDDLVKDLKISCEDYKSQILRSRIFEDHRPDDTAPYFGVSPTSKLEAVVGKMVATRAHRVYVVENHKAVGIVSQSDIIEAITN